MSGRPAGDSGTRMMQRRFVSIGASCSFCLCWPWMVTGQDMIHGELGTNATTMMYHLAAFALSVRNCAPSSFQHDNSLRVLTWIPISSPRFWFVENWVRIVSRAAHLRIIMKCFRFTFSRMCQTESVLSWFPESPKQSKQIWLIWVVKFLAPSQVN